jgi:hypothetical protein
VLGHRAGINGVRLLDYREARFAIYLPAYRWVLDHRLGDEVAKLQELSASGRVVLLDYETNGNVNDLTRPLSHASLVVAYISDKWPGE